MDISSRDSVIIVATFCCVNNFVIFLVHVFPPEGRFNNKEPGHMVYITGVKTFESAVSVIVDIMTIIGVWDMDKRTTTSRKQANGYHQKLITHLKEPKRALLLFIIWSITTSPASVGTDMVYNYTTSVNTDMFVMNAVIRCSIEAAKYYVLYRFYRLYNRLEAEQRPIIVEGAPKAASPIVQTAAAAGGGGGTTGLETAESRTGAAHFRRRTPYGAGVVPRQSITAADSASDDPILRGQGVPVVQGSATAASQRGPSYRADRRRSSVSYPNEIGEDAGAYGAGPGQNVEHKSGYDSHFGAEHARPGSRKQSYEFGAGSASAMASPTNVASDASSPVSALPQRKPGRRLSIMSPTGTTTQASNALQPVPEAAPLPGVNSTVASSSPTSVHSILRKQQNGHLPRHYQKPVEEEDVPKPLAAREDVPVLETTEAAQSAASPEQTSIMRRKGHGQRKDNGGVPAPSSPSDKSMPAVRGTTPHEEASMTTTTTTTRKKSKTTSKRRSRSRDDSKIKHKSSKHSHASARKSSHMKSSSPSSAESTLKSSPEEVPRSQ